MYDQLVKAYYVSQDWDDFFAASDKAIFINPDDLDVLPLVGWVTPRLYKQGDPDGQKKSSTRLKATTSMQLNFSRRR